MALLFTICLFKPSLSLLTTCWLLVLIACLLLVLTICLLKVLLACLLLALTTCLLLVLTICSLLVLTSHTLGSLCFSMIFFSTKVKLLLTSVVFSITFISDAGFSIFKSASTPLTTTSSCVLQGLETSVTLVHTSSMATGDLPHGCDSALHCFSISWTSSTQFS